MAIRIPVVAALLLAGSAFAADIPNPLIDYTSFESTVERVGKIRQGQRLTEFEFIAMAADPSTVILDARSREKFELLHVRGAVNLSLPDVTEAELAKIIPSKQTRVIIYCNNNFLNEPAAFPSKIAGASLNLYTFNVLFAYGYTNVYELGPLVDIRKTLIPFTRAEQLASAKP